MNSEKWKRFENLNALVCGAVEVLITYGGIAKQKL